MNTLCIACILPDTQAIHKLYTMYTQAIYKLLFIKALFVIDKSIILDFQ